MKKFSTYIIFTIISLISLQAFSVPKLNSYPGAEAVIFLDFDGHTVQSSVWNGGVTLYCQPSGLTDPQITEAFGRVAEDYRPFDINITTDIDVFLLAPLNRRMRALCTETPRQARRCSIGSA